MKLDHKRKEKILSQFTGVRSYGRLITIWLAILGAAVLWDIVTKVIQF